jgi:hypothetical protein
MQHRVHCKKRLTIFTSPAERVWLVTSRLGTGILLTFFYSVELIFCVSGHPGHPPHTHHPVLRPPHHGARHTLCIQEQGPTVQWGSHCKEPIPKIRNKYSQKRNCAAQSQFLHSFQCGNWDRGRTIPRKGTHKWDFRCSALSSRIPYRL